MEIILVWPNDYQSSFELDDDVVIIGDRLFSGKKSIFSGKNVLDSLHISNVVRNNSNKDDLILPLVEEVVLPSYNSPHIGIDFSTALNLVDRFSLRRTLRYSSYNVRYRLNRLYAKDCVIKAPFSVYSRGVRIVRDGETDFNFPEVQEHLENFGKIGFKPDYKFISEEFVEGDQIEVSGVCGIRPGEILHYFSPLLHEWDYPNGKIINYEPIDLSPELARASAEICFILGLKLCNFCFEFRGPNLKLIDAHCRLGEESNDRGNDYNELISPHEDPVSLTVRLLKKAIS